MIKELDKTDLQQALNLVNEVFNEFVAVDYSKEGKQTFNDYLKNKYEEMSADLLSGHKRVWGYYESGKIIGVIATRDISHIALMFVDKHYHNKGIAKKLFNTVLDELKGKSDITQITVNSSPYAQSVYEHLGFVCTGKQQEKNGIIFIPMKRELLLNEPFSLK